MPNHVQSNITARGSYDDILAFKNGVASLTEKDKGFDFNRIIPMPASLDVTDGGITEDACFAYILFTQNQDGAADILSYLLKKSFGFMTKDRVEKKLAELRGKMNEYLAGGTPLSAIEGEIQYEGNGIFKHPKENFANLVLLGKTYYENLTNYGHMTWYGWANENWGTKWNAYEVDVGDIEIDNETQMATLEMSFQTAWSMPEPILKKMAEMFPNIEFSGKYADEDIGSNCGTWEAKGNMFVLNEMERSEDSVRFACGILGFDPDEYLNDDEDEE